MARPVVAASGCVAAIAAVDGMDLIAATSAADYVAAARDLLEQPERASRIGAQGRRRVVESFSWDAQLSAMDEYLTGAGSVSGEELKKVVDVAA